MVLDLDETLVRFRDGPVHWRPGFADLLDSIKSCCEVVLWTASTEACVHRVMGTLDPSGDRLHHKVYRDDRWFKGTPYTKDLTLLKRDMRRVVIIENSLACVAGNPQNAILVTEYVAPDPADVALRIVRDLCVTMAENPVISVPEYLPGQQDVLTHWACGIPPMMVMGHLLLRDAGVAEPAPAGMGGRGAVNPRTRPLHTTLPRAPGTSTPI